MARLLDVDGEELRQCLLASGILSEAMAQKPDDWTVFEPKRVAEFLSGLNTGLTKERFCEILSVDDASFDGLHASGSLNAAHRPDGKWDPLVAQGIVDHLLLGAQPMARLSAGWHSLDGAAQVLGISCGEIIEMIRTGKLNWIGRYTKASGFASILVNVTTCEGGEISAEMFAQSQGVSFTEMLSFLRRRHSPAEIGQREKGRKDRISLTAVQVASFHENFISFRALGLAVKQEWDELAQQLADAGIGPVPGSPQIYRKADLRHLLDNAAQAEAEFPMEYSL